MIRESRGAPVLCSSAVAAEPLEGVLRGSAEVDDPVWLQLADGKRASIVWPSGFTIRFDPDLILSNELGSEVAREGETVTLTQVNQDPQTGTPTNPYIASGSLFGNCYPFVP